MVFTSAFCAPACFDLVPELLVNGDRYLGTARGCCRQYRWTESFT